MKKTKLIIAIISIILLIGSGITGFIFLSNKVKGAKVITTIFPIYDITRELLGSTDDIVMLQDGGTDVHSYEPTIQDMLTISKADLFIYIGGISDDRWVSKVLKSAKNNNLNTLKLFDKVDKIEESNNGVIQPNHHHHHHQEGEIVYDEHIWLSLKNMVKMTDAIEKSLIETFPKKKDIIHTNSTNYKNELLKVDKDFSSLKNAENPKTLIVADRFPFLYLTNDYDIKYNALFSTCSADSEAEFDSITKMIESINYNKVNYALVLENSTNLDTAKNIIKSNKCENKNIKLLTVNSCQSIKFDDINKTSYIKIMKDNFLNIKKAMEV